VCLHLIPEDLYGIEKLLPREPFDIVVIDGLDRFRCAEWSLRVISPCGAIILDDSEGYWGGEEKQTYPILELMRAQGYRRVDFFGHSPGGIRPHCTSFFFQSECFLFEGTEAPRRTIW